MSVLPIAHPPDPSPEPVFRLSVEQYHTMINAGALTDDDPVELLEGILVFKMPKKPSHRFVLRALFKAIEKMLPGDSFIQLQEPITLEDGEPEPDASIIRGSDQLYAARHPGAADVMMVIEISDTTLSRDRGIKLRSYARAGIAAYWIVNLANRSIEVYGGPNADASNYLNRNIHDEKSSVTFELEGQKLGEIAVASIFPEPI